MKRFLALLLIKFFFISALFIISNEDLNMRNPTERAIFIEHYSLWITGIFNRGVKIMGAVINTEWLPKENSSLLSHPES